MKLETIELKNFRCFGSLTIPVGGTSLFIVSENAGGKSSLLTAVAKALGRDPFAAAADFDSLTDPFEVIVTLTGFEPADQATFPDELSFKGKPSLRVGMRAVWDAAEREADVRVGFPDHNWKKLSRLQREALPLIWLPAWRDPTRILQLTSARSLLSQLMRELKLDGPLGAALTSITAALEEFAAHADLASFLNSAQERLSHIIPGVQTDAFSLGAPGAHSKELFSEFELLLAHNGPALPVSKQSNGLTHLAVLVFVIHTLAQQKKALLLLDEPELSLHPQAQRALMDAVRALPNQSLVATHSSNILDRADPRTLTRLDRSGGTVSARRPAHLVAEDATKLMRFANPQTTEACFGRKVVLVEGYSDRLVLMTLAQRLGRQLDASGVTVLSLDGGSTVGSYLSLFGPNGLGLEVLGLCDEDKEKKWQQELQKVGIPATSRAAMAAAGFFVCAPDLEAEFVKSLGTAGTQAVIASEGAANTFAQFTAGPPNSTYPLEEQLRLFLHKHNVPLAIPLSGAADLNTLPPALHGLLSKL
jgi:putative ATP-dependent endonuclease of the OLD family